MNSNLGIEAFHLSALELIVLLAKAGKSSVFGMLLQPKDESREAILYCLHGLIQRGLLSVGEDAFMMDFGLASCLRPLCNASCVAKILPQDADAVPICAYFCGQDTALVEPNRYQDEQYRCSLIKTDDFVETMETCGLLPDDENPNRLPRPMLVMEFFSTDGDMHFADIQVEDFISDTIVRLVKNDMVNETQYSKAALHELIMNVLEEVVP